MNSLYLQPQNFEEENRKYYEARNDLIKAYNSLNQLSPNMRNQLLNEMAQLAIWVEFLRYLNIN